MRKFGLVMLTVLLAVALPLSLAVTPALANDSPTFGYNYQHTRQFSDSVMASKVLPAVPWTVPISGKSNSTPVEYGNELYQFAYYFGGSQFALWGVNIAGSKPGTAKEVFGPITALPGENFGQQQTAGLGVSPGGTYIAVAAGERIFVWPAGNPSGVKIAWMMGPNSSIREMSSGDPVFVPVPTSVDPSGLAACGDDWDGSLWCFGVSSGIQINWQNGGDHYYATMDHPHDTSASITASPTLVPASGAPGGGSEVCAGVSGTAHGRVACIHPDGSHYAGGKSYFVMADGSVYHAGGIAAAAPYAAGRLIAQGVYGGLYEIDTRTGQVVARTDILADYPELDIAAPAFALANDPGVVVGVAAGWADACAVNFQTGRIQGCLSSPTTTVPQPTSGTVVTPATVIQEGTNPHAWLAESSQIVDVNMIGGSLVQSATEGKLANPWATLVADVGTRRAFALWGNNATAFWCLNGENAYAVGAGCGSGDLGGLQIWYATEPLTAWFETNPTTVPQGGGVPSGGECLLALATPGEFMTLTATLPNGSRVQMQTSPSAVGEVTQLTGPLFATDPPHGCPTPQATADYWQSLNRQWGSSGPSGSYPGMVDRQGTAPGQFSSYQLWWATGIAVPSKQGVWKSAVSGTAADGTPHSVSPSLYTNCPAGNQVVQDGACLPPPAPPPTCASGPRTGPQPTCVPSAPAPSEPPCGWQTPCQAKPPVWYPVLICGGPIICNGIPRSEQPGAFLPEPCDPTAPPGDPARCPSASGYTVGGG